MSDSEARATLDPREALRLIAWHAGRDTGCENYVGNYTCRDESSERTKDAEYLADRWCQSCTATAALEAMDAGTVTESTEPLLAFTVHGDPVAQGGVTAFIGNDERARVAYKNPKQLQAFRADVAWQISEAKLDRLPRGIAVEVVASFVMARPKAHYGTGRNAEVLKASAPRWHTSRPDADKLMRALLDSLEKGGLITDDSQVAMLSVEKVYAETGSGPRTEVAVYLLEAEKQTTNDEGE